MSADIERHSEKAAKCLPTFDGNRAAVPGFWQGYDLAVQTSGEISKYDP